MNSFHRCLSSCSSAENKEDIFIERVLHFPYSTQELAGVLKRKGINPNKPNRIGNSPLHSLIASQYRKRKLKADLLYTFFTECDEEIYIDQPNAAGNTALHLAVEVKDIEVVKILLAFGADINRLNRDFKTPLDFCMGQYMYLHRQDSYSTVSIEGSERNTKFEERRSALVELMKDCGAIRGKDAFSFSVVRKKYLELNRRFCLKLGHEDSEEKSKRRISGLTTSMEHLQKSFSDLFHSKAAQYYQCWTSVMQNPINLSSDDLSKAADYGFQIKNMRLLQRAGSRVLVLDGGGMKGIIEIEILDQIEKATGMKIVDLFDWIVGTSTGAIIALGLVYTRFSLHKMRQLTYRLKDSVFKSTFGLSFSTTHLNDYLQHFFKDMTMSSRTYPRVVITAVNKADTNNLKLEFFGNHSDIDPHYRERLVWKVARYSSSAPILFKELDNYVDGGVLANNPSSAALTFIQQIYSKKKLKIPVSMVVSLGCGIQPEDKLCRVDSKYSIILSCLKRLIGQAADMMTVLDNALTESQQVAKDMSRHCKEQGIKYFRCNPHLNLLLTCGETDKNILINAILDAKKCLKCRREVDLLKLWFPVIWSANEELHKSGLL